MASLKAEKPSGSQLFGQVKKDPPKAAGEGASKAKPAPKKAEQKPKEPKKKVIVLDLQTESYSCLAGYPTVDQLIQTDVAQA
ncbi:hypothetical protein Sjap_024289 [Stephania japonica]|uniref:Uncharacterized protein n=1 Tax=Stephania japonica TaxID=461633 RepID=A0AAP0EHW7_9MAGN